MQLDESAENNIPNKFPAAFQNGTFSYHNDIESKLNEILEEKIMKQKPGAVFIMARKGLNLFHPFLTRLKQKHAVSEFNINRSSQYSLTKRLGRRSAYLRRSGKKGFLLTDAVNKGNDIQKVNQFLKKRNVVLSVVCGYFCSYENLEDLKKCYPKVAFEFVFEAKSDEEYWTGITHLMQLSQTRMEPLDRDHCFHLYRLEHELSKEQILSIFTNFFQNTLETPCVFDNDPIKPFEEGIESYTAYLDDLEQLSTKLQLNNSQIFEINQLFLRLKIDGETTFTRIMPYFEIDVNLENLRNDDEFCSNLHNPCCQMKSYMKNGLKTRCAQCIENNLAYILLNGIEAHFLNNPTTRGFHLSLEGRHYPCNPSRVD